MLRLPLRRPRRPGVCGQFALCACLVSAAASVRADASTGDAVTMGATEVIQTLDGIPTHRIAIETIDVNQTRLVSGASKFMWFASP